MKEKILQEPDYNHITYTEQNLEVEDCFKDKLNKHGQIEDEGACEDEI